MRIRKLFDEFEADYLVIDAKGNGLPIVDLIMGDLYDKDAGRMYGALGCCNNEEIHARCVYKNAPKVIWAILGTEVFNSQCALLLREAFRNGTIRLLQSDYDCKDSLSLLSGYNKLTIEDKQDFQLPYMHVSLLVNELINLQAEQKSTTSTVRVYEKSGMRKDRYSSLAYNIYVSKEIEREMAKPRNNMDTLASMLSFKAPLLT